MKNISKYFDELSTTLQDYLDKESNEFIIEEVINKCVHALTNGNGVYFCGNGGSAAEAMHLAAEFSGRYKLDRKALKSDCLAANPSFMTAVGNDYGYEHVFARAIESIGKSGDLLFLLSTSGNSNNIINAAIKANEMQIITISMTGDNGGKLLPLCTHAIRIPSENTPRIQELHLLIGHIICEEVEKRIFQK
jgi:D-sedoheptulose 7-phosphate isomerase